MNIVTRLFVFALVLFLVSCSASSVMQNRDKHYLSAKSVPPLHIPPGVSAASFHTEYPVSNRTYSLSAEEVSIVPPGLYN